MRLPLSDKQILSELVERDGLYYQKFSDVPYSGAVEEEYTFGGFREGRIENGLKEGPWIQWYDNGQIWTKWMYHQGTIEYFERRHENGQLEEVCEYQNGKMHGLFTRYFENGQIEKFY